MESTGTKLNKMPELPEVQTVLSTLEQQIKGLSIEDVTVFTKNIVQNPVEVFKDRCIDRKFIGFHRKGKYLVFELSQGYLIVHLRMEGRFFIRNYIEKNKHVHVVFALSGGRYLHYQDTRKFGRMIALENKLEVDAYLSRLGMDGLDHNLSGSYLKDKAKNKTRSIKSFLLAQENVAGIGNIVDEICFYAKLHPDTSVSKLSKKKFDEIAQGIITILEEATSLGGSSIRSYTDSLGISGRFQLQLKVHMRKDACCYECNTPIIKTVVANRGTYLCPKCQKLKK
jgi:formamidopyrimidine-DNA glycosylase